MKLNHTIPNRSRFSSFAVLTGFVSLFAYAVIFTITPAAINELKNTFGASDSMMALLYGVTMGTFFVVAIVGGQLADRVGKIPVLLVGAVAMALGGVVYVLAPSFVWLFPGMLLMGGGGGLAETMGTAVIADFTDDKRRTATMNWSQIVFVAGAVAAPWSIAGLIARHMNWRIGYVGAFVVCVVAALVALVTMFLGKETLRSSTEAGQQRWRDLIRSPLVIALSLGILLYVGAECGFANWLAVYFKKELGASGSFAAMSVAAFWLFVGVGRLVATKIAGRVSDLTMICWGLGVAGVAQALTLLMHSPGPALIGTFVVGAFFGPTWPTIMSVAGKNYPNQTGTVFGIVVAFGALGAAIFPAAVGRGADVIGLRASLWVCPVAAAVNCLVFILLRSGRIARQADGEHIHTV